MRARARLAEPLRAVARRLDKRHARRVALAANLLDPPIDLSDHYTDHLGYAIAGMLARGNLWCFDQALRHLPSDAPIVEIGSFCGLSASVLTYYKRRLGLRHRLVTCDSWGFEQAMAGDVPVSRADYGRFVKDSYVRAMQTFAAWDLPYTVEAYADDFFGAWRAGETRSDVFGRSVTLGGPIGFAYVDGNHDYDHAKRDFEHVAEFLEPGGHVLFDDSYDGSGWGVTRLMPEIRARAGWELVARNPNYLFRKR